MVKRLVQRFVRRHLAHRGCTFSLRLLGRQGNSRTRNLYIRQDDLRHYLAGYLAQLRGWESRRLRTKMRHCYLEDLLESPHLTNSLPKSQ